MIIQHNLQAMFTNRELGIVTGNKAKSQEKLSSGYRVNRAADDAAGLTISEGMRRQIRGLTQASKNCQDAVSLSQVADGYLNEVHDMLHRVNELSVKASNGTLTNDDRRNINEEVTALKDEMRRIFTEANFNGIPLFHVPYTPEITGYPNDMGTFGLISGTTHDVEGLTFNNVRYNIEELQDKGLKIDDSGCATEDFSVSFELWDGETVDLSMKTGQQLKEVTRNYKWKADETGIYINNKLAAEWSEVRNTAGAGITDPTSIKPGRYSFSHHGMNITFDITEKSNIEDVMAGINGDAATKPVTWDVSVGSYNSRQSADIVDSTSSQQITVTNSNKDVIDWNYSIVADENGLAIKSTNRLDPSDFSVTDYVAWSTFKDSNFENITDENGNAVETNGGYPITNWGESVDGNGKDEITFDGNATYHFTSPDADVPIEFDFTLSEAAVLSDVRGALDGVDITAWNVNAPGRLSASATTSVGRIYVGTTRTLANSFNLQRLYGRDFDNSSATLTADITVERTTIAGQPSADDRPNATGGYTGNTHSVVRSLQSRELDSRTDPRATEYPIWIGIMPETYTDYSLDEFGNRIQETDEFGNPKTDENGDLVYQTQEYTRWHYFEQYEHHVTEKYTNTYDALDTWTQQVQYTFDGSLEGHDMRDQSRIQTETYERTFEQTRTETVQYWRHEFNEEDYPALHDLAKLVLENKPEIFEDTSHAYNETFTIPIGGGQPDARIAVLRYTYYDPDRILDKDGQIYSPNSLLWGNYSTTESTISDATMTEIGTAYFSDITFRDESSNTPFTFDFQTDLNKARTLAASTGEQSAGTIKFTAAGNATRQFRPNEHGLQVQEDQFSMIQLNPPKKSLDIQAGANKGDHVTMKWNPLNLTLLGISNANTLTLESARNSIAMVNHGVDVISETRSTFGAYQNRFESTIRNLDNVVENTQAAESVIRDTDMAAEMVKYAKENILQQVGQAMLAQINRSREGVLSLLR